MDSPPGGASASKLHQKPQGQLDQPQGHSDGFINNVPLFSEGQPTCLSSELVKGDDQNSTLTLKSASLRSGDFVCMCICPVKTIMRIISKVRIVSLVALSKVCVKNRDERGTGMHRGNGKQES